MTNSSVALSTSHFVGLSGERAPLSAGQLGKLICHFRLLKWSRCCFSALHNDWWCGACPSKLHYRLPQAYQRTIFVCIWFTVLYADGFSALFLCTCYEQSCACHVLHTVDISSHLGAKLFTPSSAGLSGVSWSEVLSDNNVIVMPCWSERWRRGTPPLSLIQALRNKKGVGGWCYQGTGWVDRSPAWETSRDGWGRLGRKHSQYLTRKTLKRTRGV